MIADEGQTALFFEIHYLLAIALCHICLYCEAMVKSSVGRAGLGDVTCHATTQGGTCGTVVAGQRLSWRKGEINGKFGWNPASFLYREKPMMTYFLTEGELIYLFYYSRIKSQINYGYQSGGSFSSPGSLKNFPWSPEHKAFLCLEPGRIC